MSQPPPKKTKPASSAVQRDLFGNVARTGRSVVPSKPAACTSVTTTSAEKQPNDANSRPIAIASADELLDVDVDPFEVEAARDDAVQKKKRMAFDRTLPLFDMFQFQMDGASISHYQCTVCNPGKWNKFKARTCYEHVGVKADGSSGVLLDAPTKQSAKHKGNVADFRRKQELQKHGVHS
jgi:hypothetical protein